MNNELVEDYYYRFKPKYRLILDKFYNHSEDRVNYTNIRLYDKNYEKFIEKLEYLYNDNSSFTKKEIISIKRLLESDNLMDRLKGLKVSRVFIKIEVMRC